MTLALADDDLALDDVEAHRFDASRGVVLGLLRQLRVVGRVGDQERRDDLGRQRPLVDREPRREPADELRPRVVERRCRGPRRAAPSLSTRAISVRRLVHSTAVRPWSVARLVGLRSGLRLGERLARRVAASIGAANAASIGPMAVSNSSPCRSALCSPFCVV